MFALNTDTRQLDRLESAVAGTARSVPKELTIAINRTAKKSQTQMSRQIRTKIVITARDLRPLIAIVRRARPSSLGATVQLSATKRPSLRAFKVRQTKAGVTYKINRGEGRKLVPGGFMGPNPRRMSVRLKGHAYKRQGQQRKPIVRLHAVSPIGTYLKNKMRPTTVREGNQTLRKEVDRRIDFLTKKRLGVI